MIAVSQALRGALEVATRLGAHCQVRYPGVPSAARRAPSCDSRSAGPQALRGALQAATGILRTSHEHHQALRGALQDATSPSRRCDSLEAATLARWMINRCAVRFRTATRSSEACHARRFKRCAARSQLRQARTWSQALRGALQAATSPSRRCDSLLSCDTRPVDDQSLRSVLQAHGAFAPRLKRCATRSKLRSPRLRLKRSAARSKLRQVRTTTYALEGNRHRLQALRCALQAATERSPTASRRDRSRDKTKFVRARAESQAQRSALEAATPATQPIVLKRCAARSKLRHRRLVQSRRGALEARDMYYARGSRQALRGALQAATTRADPTRRRGHPAGTMLHATISTGSTGFDVVNDDCVACRGGPKPLQKPRSTIAANDNSYAQATAA
jgi:hypothetical protein